jgi:hypothetical protein
MTESANLALRFALELVALAALAYWGVHVGESPGADVALGVGAPLVAAIVWGRWAAPRSERRLTGWRLTALQLAVLLTGAAALAAAGHAVVGAIFAGVVVLNALALEA